MKLFRHILSFAIIAAFALTSALSHAHPKSHEMSADNGHHMMHQAMAGDHAGHHGDMGDNASKSEDAAHCCSVGPCGFLSPASPHLSHSTASVVVREMTASPRISVETPPDSPPPRTVA